MKANELMIGDWVKFPTSDLCYKVYAVQGKSVKIDKQYWHKADNLEPVLFTPEILDKNFPPMYEDDYRYTKRENGIGVDINYTILKPGGYDQLRMRKEPEWLCWWMKINYGKTPVVMINFNYVHELQHALRLCGIEKEIEL